MPLGNRSVKVALQFWPDNFPAVSSRSGVIVFVVEMIETHDFVTLCRQPFAGRCSDDAGRSGNAHVHRSPA